MVDDGLRQVTNTLRDQSIGFLPMLASTPAFVVDLEVLAHRLASLQVLRKSGIDLLYSIKALPLGRLLEFMLPLVDGFSVSSLYEARLAHQVSNGQKKLCMTSPGLSYEQLPELADLCTHISLNSQTMFSSAAMTLQQKRRAAFGVRLNPGLSFLDDDRYNPCRTHSKLGVALDDFMRWPSRAALLPSGWHFHTVFDREDAESLRSTLHHLSEVLGQRPDNIRWINLGGGYRLRDARSTAVFVNVASDLQAQGYGEIMIEPGKGIVGDAGFLVSSVTDTFISDGKQIAVLDTSINHHPEVFEYQRAPRLAEKEEGDYPVMLVGGTCLAGDIFGEYRLSRRLKVGDRIVMRDVGAYTLVKANLFNGHPLPDIHFWDGSSLSLVRSHGFADFMHLWAQA